MFKSILFKFIYVLGLFNASTITSQENSQKFTPIESPSVDAPPSLHILIATVGRPSLLRMLKSLEPQLKADDYLTIVFDAVDKGGMYEQVNDYIKHFDCSCSLIMESLNLGYWGHGIRNKHNLLEGDFIMHADDDDQYTPHALETIRAYCKDRTTLYIFKIALSSKRIIWTQKKIQGGHIGTPMGVIPSAYNFQALWGHRFGGDFDFYNQLQFIVPKVEFIDFIIYKCRNANID